LGDPHWRYHVIQGERQEIQLEKRLWPKKRGWQEAQLMERAEGGIFLAGI
jgi:hypothetical protein